MKHKFGDELISKGVKFSAKVIENNLFPDKNIYRDESNYNVPEEVNLIADISLENWSKRRSYQRTHWPTREELH